MKMRICRKGRVVLSGLLTIAVLVSSALSGLRAEGDSLPASSGRNKSNSFSVFLTHTIEDHPQVRESYHRYRSLEEKAENADRLTDPRLMISRTQGNVRERSLYPAANYTNRSMTTDKLEIIQDLPFPGKLTLAESVRRKEAVAGYHSHRMLVNSLSVNYLELLSEYRMLQKSLEITGGMLAKASILVRVTESRYETGRSPLTDASRAAAYYQRFKDKRLKLEQKMSTIQEEISFFTQAESGGMNRNHQQQSISRFPGKEISFSGYRVFLNEVRQGLPELSSSEDSDGKQHGMNHSEDFRKWEGHSPEISYTAAMQEANEAGVDLARLEYLPDFSFLAAVSRGNGNAAFPVVGEREENYYTVGIGIELPLFSALENDNLVDQRANQNRSANLSLRSARLRFRSSLRSGLRSLDLLEKRIALFERSIIPQAKQAHDSARITYEAGRSDFDTLLAARDELYEDHISLLQLRNQKEQTVFRMAALLGRLPGNEKGATADENEKD